MYIILKVEPFGLNEWFNSDSSSQRILRPTSPTTPLRITVQIFSNIDPHPLSLLVHYFYRQPPKLFITEVVYGQRIWKMFTLFIFRCGRCGTSLSWDLQINVFILSHDGMLNYFKLLEFEKRDFL